MQLQTRSVDSIYTLRNPPLFYKSSLGSMKTTSTCHPKLPIAIQDHWMCSTTGQQPNVTTQERYSRPSPQDLSWGRKEYWLGMLQGQDCNAQSIYRNKQSSGTTTSCVTLARLGQRPPSPNTSIGRIWGKMSKTCVQSVPYVKWTRETRRSMDTYLRRKQKQHLGTNCVWTWLVPTPSRGRGRRTWPSGV